MESGRSVLEARDDHAYGIAKGQFVAAFSKVELSEDSLLLIPCSARKRTSAAKPSGPSLLTALDPLLALELQRARQAMRTRAAIDETTLLPAFRRYSGHLYVEAAEDIAAAIKRGQRVLIISGGYGLALAQEPLGTYNRMFSLRDWPSNLLERCLLSYTKREGVHSVVAVMSRSTGYARLVEHVDWGRAGVTTTLVVPVVLHGNAQVQGPRAQGEAIRALLSEGRSATWQSSDLNPLMITET